MERGAEKFPWWGADGCEGGWFCVGLNETTGICSFVAPDIEVVYSEVCRRGGKLILIDIPIGLQYGREADKLARSCLGDLAAAVFPVPCREAVEIYDETYRQVIKSYGGKETTKDEKTAARKVAGQKARAKNKEVTKKIEPPGKSLSSQTLSIVPKIIDVDDFLRSGNSNRYIFREVHPELCFRMLNRAPLEYSKKSALGFYERQEILNKYFLKPEYGGKASFDQVLESGTKEIGGAKMKKVTADDINDALVAALTAKLGGPGGHKLRTLPPKPLKDSRGLPMEMVYVCGNEKG